MLPFLLDSLIFKNPRWIHNLIYLQCFINQGLNISFTGLLIGWNKRARFLLREVRKAWYMLQNFCKHVSPPPLHPCPTLPPAQRVAFLKRARSRWDLDVWRLHKPSSHVITTLPDGLAWQLLMHRATCFIRWYFPFPLPPHLSYILSRCTGKFLWTSLWIPRVSED